MKKNEQLIGEILLDQLPKNILGALRVMASLTYPISDRRSFIAQLENLVKVRRNRRDQNRWRLYNSSVERSRNWISPY